MMNLSNLSNVDWSKLLVDMLPLAVAMLVFFWLSRLYTVSKSGMSVVDIQVAVVNEMRKQNQVLERIAEALEKKNAG